MRNKSAGFTSAAAVAVISLSACATDPQRAEIKRLQDLGYKKVAIVAEPGQPQALAYFGEVNGLVSCSDNGAPLRVSDAVLHAEGAPGRFVRQDSTLDSYVIVNGDGSSDATHILTLVRLIEQGNNAVAREVVTTEVSNTEPGQLGRLGTCNAA